MAPGFCRSLTFFVNCLFGRFLIQSSWQSKTQYCLKRNQRSLADASRLSCIATLPQALSIYFLILDIWQSESNV